MIQFTKPTNLNGTELIKELAQANINIVGLPMIENEILKLDISEADTATATAVVAAHNGTTVAPDNSAAKAALFAKLGITADEAKLLLG